MRPIGIHSFTFCFQLLPWSRFTWRLESVIGSPIDTWLNLNVHKMFRRRPGFPLIVLCTFNLRPVSTGRTCHGKMQVSLRVATLSPFFFYTWTGKVERKYFTHVIQWLVFHSIMDPHSQKSLLFSIFSPKDLQNVLYSRNEV